MSTQSVIMMIVVLGGYAAGAFFLMSKVFSAQQARQGKD
jgi:hypothetical protein